MEEIVNAISPYLLSCIIAIIMPVLIKKFSLKDIVGKIDNLLNDGTVSELKQQVEVLNDEVTKLKEQVNELKEQVAQLNNQINKFHKEEETTNATYTRR